ncbi:hypothetical protein [Enterococcus entomosocium]|uniref:hypothetical protein n=1 Tax=Enterococcus entomosocium TaxID=3034352 RepID=UPI002647E6DF|nr:hypothetical protein [Enterococcus entomosocium]
MNKLLQAKIAGVRVLKLRGEITEDNFSFFVRGVNHALRFMGLQYDADNHAVIDATDAMYDYSNDDLKNAQLTQLAFFKRGFFLVTVTVENAGELPIELKDESEIIREL